jgi:nucleoside-diphosphate-sugar epimerase
MRRLAGRRMAVTGAGGFIGSALVRRLVAEKVEVHALLGPPDTPVIAPPTGVKALHGEIDHPDCLAALLDGVDVVFHLAGPASVASSFAAPVEFARIHGVGTAAVLAACERARVQHVVYLSSAEVYGRPLRNPIDETHRLQACSPYAAAKLAAEHFLEAHHLAHRLSITVLRPFSVYGPRQSPHGLVAAILRQLDRGEVRLADLRPVRDFCFVDDVVDAAVRAAAVRPTAWHLVLNVGSGVGTSVETLARLMVQLRGGDAQVIGGDEVDRPVDSVILQRVADTSRIRTLLGWEAKTSLESGLRQTLAWWDDESLRTSLRRAPASGPRPTKTRSGTGSDTGQGDVP